MHIFSVFELTQAVKDVLEGEFPFVWVRGQVSNLSQPPSGHIYFTLKDDHALLNVVWFKGAQPARPRIEENNLSRAQDPSPSILPGLEPEEHVHPLTGEVHSGPGLVLQNDLEVLVAGRINVYAPRGSYQLVAELVQEQGVGQLALAFEALKSKLKDQGYFDEQRKMRVPTNPRRVAVITAPQGAALQDFLHIAAHRGLGATLTLYPTQVQGEAAPGQIAMALHQVAAQDWAQVVVLIRGGGSLEDLWAFNTEVVAQAMYQCPLPIITGIGHEVDTTIADLVADLRTATPSHVAQVLWTEREVLKQQVDELFWDLQGAMGQFLNTKETFLNTWQQALGWQSPTRRIENNFLELHNQVLRLQHALENFMYAKLQAIHQVQEALEHSFGPLVLAEYQAELQHWQTTLYRAGINFLAKSQDKFQNLQALLTALDPDAPLARGYALVEKSDQNLVRSTKQVGAGEILKVRVQDGQFLVEVQ